MTSKTIFEHKSKDAVATELIILEELVLKMNESVSCIMDGE